MDQLPTVLEELSLTKQQVDSLEKEMSARTKENLLLKSHAQEMMEYADGLNTTMPREWSLEEQNTALRLTIRFMREKSFHDEALNIEFKEKEKLDILVRLLMAENEEHCKSIEKLEKKIQTLAGSDSKSSKEKIMAVDKINNKNVNDYWQNNSLHEKATESLKYNEVDASKESDDINKKLNSSNNKLTDEEFCELQMRLLEENCKLSETEQVLLDEKLSVVHNPEVGDKSQEDIEELALNRKPCKVFIHGIGWGLSPAMVLKYLRNFQGVIDARFSGESAQVSFESVDLCEKFIYHKHGCHSIDGYFLEVGEVVEDLCTDLEKCVTDTVGTQKIREQRNVGCNQLDEDSAAFVNDKPEEDDDLDELVTSVAVLCCDK